MRILAIETSCDETGIALVEVSGPSTSSGQAASLPRFRVLKNLISSQITVHRPFGGVVPNLAKREHTKNLPILFRRIFGNPKSETPLRQAQRPELSRGINSKQSQKSKFKISNVDLISVTVGPGLEPALWAGITFARELAKKYGESVIGVNHMKGHLYSFLLSDHKPQTTARNKKTVIRSPSTVVRFPAIALIVSGGHTILLLMESLTKWKKLGETRDDAAGEAFDKVARLLNLPYPGGPEIEKMAKKGNPNAVAFPRPMMDQKNYDFSFSGLKTAVLYYLRDPKNSYENTKNKKNNFRTFVQLRTFVRKADVAASFQQAVVDTLISKTMRAAREYAAKSVILCGGVTANELLKSELRQATRKMGMYFFTPSSDYNTDNAAMIAAAGYFAYLKNKKLPLVANGDLGI